MAAIETTGKFPEYHKVWEDNVLRVVAVFGKYEDGATSGDAGISAFNRFVSLMNSAVRSMQNVETTPAEVQAVCAKLETLFLTAGAAQGGATLFENASATA